MKQNLDIHFFRKRLTKRLIELNELAEFGDAAARPVELDQTRVGRLSRMDAMQAQAMSIEAKRRRQNEAQNVRIFRGKQDKGVSTCEVQCRM